MTVLLTIFSVLAVVAFFVVVAVFVHRIAIALESIGGTDSSLSKIRYGVRAIEVETGHIAPQVTQLNQALAAAAGGLKSIDDTLARIAAAAVKQGFQP